MKKMLAFAALAGIIALLAVALWRKAAPAPPEPAARAARADASRAPAAGLSPSGLPKSYIPDAVIAVRGARAIKTRVSPSPKAKPAETASRGPGNTGGGMRDYSRIFKAKSAEYETKMGSSTLRMREKMKAHDYRNNFNKDYGGKFGGDDFEGKFGGSGFEDKFEGNSNNGPDSP